MDKLDHDSFKSLIKKLKEANYEFTSFSKVKYSSDDVQKKVILRHDIDLTLEKAVEMAQLEYELGISAVYFLFLRSPFYNLFSQKGEKLVRILIEYNHYIGLHFDYSAFRHISPSTVTYNIMQEIQFMESFFQVKLDSVSFHRPFSLDFFAKLELGMYPHAYESLFVKKFFYCSDSRGFWRYGHPLESDAFKKGDPLQILIHPVWWKENFEDAFDSLRDWKNEFQEHYFSSAYNELKGFWDSQSHLTVRDL